MSLPPPPKKLILHTQLPGHYWYGDVVGHTDAAMKAYGQQCLSLALEEAAQVCGHKAETKRLECSLTHKLNSDRTAAVSLDAVWIPIDANTPRGVNMWLISKTAGVSQKGMYDPAKTFFTHWFPNPRFED